MTAGSESPDDPRRRASAGSWSPPRPRRRLTVGEEVVVILGPNGAGKTTLLRILAGLEPIDAGHVTVDGAMSTLRTRPCCVAPERRPVGVVFQDYLLFPFLSVRENVAFPLRSRGVPKRDARARADASTGTRRPR